MISQMISRALVPIHVYIQYSIILLLDLYEGMFVFIQAPFSLFNTRLVIFYDSIHKIFIPQMIQKTEVHHTKQVFLGFSLGISRSILTVLVVISELEIKSANDSDEIYFKVSEAAIHITLLNDYKFLTIPGITINTQLFQD